MELIDRLEEQGKILVIRPEHSLNIGRMEHDPEELQRVYDIGRTDGIRYLNAVKKWLG